ncbi:hypothetical protein F6R98_12105 [Candidatus Methylospira mobilis]|uniref:Toxin CptA n=1 Tax=Candidatus Methylospira mobilis TaxID=1808979 RepID=A0A5Q0BMC2_9GAMM|nr:protein YgfX [Candidatus Methylospira mobilis]QFY43268.1 hypothetical protein F6R98_12105 [Candidatus Methylospira mobilis]WNV03529.1 protein YgfX [Candidatus Methylospira mobilis]
MLRLDPVPSRSLWWFVWLVHSGALLAVGVSGIPLWLKVGLTVLIGVSCWLQLHNIGRVKISALEFRTDQGWLLHLRNGQILAGTLSAGSLVLGKIAFLYFKTARGRKSLLLMPDSVPRAEYRKLRLLVRIKPSGLLQPPNPFPSKPLRTTSKANPVV